MRLAKPFMLTFRAWPVTLIFALSLWLPVATAQEKDLLKLEIGAVATLFASDIARHEVADTNVVEVVRADRLNLRLRGRGTGSTVVTVWNSDNEPSSYQITVEPRFVEHLPPAQPAMRPALQVAEETPALNSPHLSSQRGQQAPPDPVSAPALQSQHDQARPPSNSILSKPGHRPLDLFVGSVVTERIGRVRRMVVGNDEIAEASLLDGGELLVLGKSQGITELQVMMASGIAREYLVRVYAAPPDDAMELLQAALAQYPDIHIQAKLGRLIVTGTVNAADFERYTESLRDFPGVLSTVTAQLNIEIEPTVVLDVAVLEVNRTYQKTIGVRWQDTGPGPVTGVVGNLVPNNRFGVVSQAGEITEDLETLLGAVGTGSQKLSGYLGITSIIGSELQFLQEEGLARVLAAPSLSTVSGEQATFLAGGDFPVAILNQFGQPVIEFREFGVQLEIEPVVDRMLNVRSRIRAEVSSVDFTTQVNGVPGLLRRETVSTITARPGDTIILSGLLDARDSKNVDKVPGLGSIPIIGQLFRSDDFIKQRTELIITVTPRIQAPNAPLSPNLAQADRHLRGTVLTGSKGIDRALITIGP